MLRWIKSHQKTAMQVTSLLLIATTITLLCFSIQPAPQIVSFDFKGTQQSFTAQLSKRSDITETEKNNIAQRFGQSVEAVTQAYADKHHSIVLVRPAVIAGAKDITNQLQSEILNRMKRDV